MWGSLFNPLQLPRVTCPLCPNSCLQFQGLYLAPEVPGFGDFICDFITFRSTAVISDQMIIPFVFKCRQLHPPNSLGHPLWPLQFCHVGEMWPQGLRTRSRVPGTQGFDPDSNIFLPIFQTHITSKNANYTNQGPATVVYRPNLACHLFFLLNEVLLEHNQDHSVCVCVSNGHSCARTAKSSSCNRTRCTQKSLVLGRKALATLGLNTVH